MQVLWQTTASHQKKGLSRVQSKMQILSKWHHFASVCMARKKREVNLLEENCESSEESILQVEEISTAALNFHRKQARHHTGVICNVLSYRDLSIINQDGNPLVEQSKTKFKLFDGLMMKPLGVVNLRITYGSQTQVLQFQVASGSNKPLLSAQTCQKLGLLKLGSQPEVLSLHEKHIPNYTQYTVLQITEMSLSDSDTVDRTAVHVQYTSRWIPVALRNDIKAKLADLETKGIIKKEKVPTEWISNMVVVAKPGKIQTCLAPRELNKVIQHPRYQMPTHEELLPKL